MSLILLVVAALAAPVASAQRTPNRAFRSTCWSGYSYTGAQSPQVAYGVSGNLTLVKPSTVNEGHVAAWLGVGGAGMGPGGSDEWVQAGIAHDAGSPNDVLYYEFKRPGDVAATYVRLGAVRPGVAHEIVVYERAAQRDTWRVMIDGTKLGDPIVLPRSHGAFKPVATTENWDGGLAGSCNSYAYDFAGLSVRAQNGGTWQPFDLSRVLHDPAYDLSLRASGFLASSR